MNTCVICIEMALCAFVFIFQCVTAVATLLYLKPLQFLREILIHCDICLAIRGFILTYFINPLKAFFSFYLKLFFSYFFFVCSYFSCTLLFFKIPISTYFLQAESFEILHFIRIKEDISHIWKFYLYLCLYLCFLFLF